MEVLDLEPEQIEPPPKIGTGLDTEFIRGMGKHDERFLIILDIDRVFSSEELAMVGGPASEAAAEIARSMRALLAETPNVRRPEIDALIGECDARSYAPPGQGAELDDVFRERGRELAGRIAEGAP